LAVLSDLQTNGGGAEGADLRGYPEEDCERVECIEYRLLIREQRDQLGGSAPAQTQDEASRVDVQGQAS